MDKCTYCGLALRARGQGRATRDHVRPRSLGGGPTVPACSWCNQLKGAMPLEEFRAIYSPQALARLSTQARVAGASHARQDARAIAAEARAVLEAVGDVEDED